MSASVNVESVPARGSSGPSGDVAPRADESPRRAPSPASDCGTHRPASRVLREAPVVALQAAIVALEARRTRRKAVRLQGGTGGKRCGSCPWCEMRPTFRDLARMRRP